jgi:hypothetical protein
MPDHPVPLYACILGKVVAAGAAVRASKLASRPASTAAEPRARYLIVPSS